MIEKIKTLGMSREDWLVERKNSLGGSDVGAILGLNRYRSPYAVWAEKTGRVSERPDNEAMRQGRDLEAYVAQRFVEKSGKNVERCNFLLRNTEAPYLHANIDRRVVGEKSGLECKTASALSLKNYAGGEFPESYYAQCVAYLAVTGWERWYLAALVLNKAFFVYQITTIKDDALPEWCESSVYVAPEELSAMKRCAADFWESYVLTDEPPPLDGLSSTTNTLKTVYGDESASGEAFLFGRERELSQYFMLKEKKEELERQMEEIRQNIMQDMGGAESASCGMYKISWRMQTRNTFDTKKFKKAYPKLDLTPFYKSTTLRPMKITEVS